MYSRKSIAKLFLIFFASVSHVFRGWPKNGPRKSQSEKNSVSIKINRKKERKIFDFYEVLILKHP